MHARRKLRRNIMLIAILGVCSMTAVTLSLMGMSRMRKALRDERGLMRIQIELARYIAEMKREVSFLANGLTTASVHRVAGYSEEAEEIMDHFNEIFGRDFGDATTYESMNEEWNELFMVLEAIKKPPEASEGQGQKINWHRYMTDLETFKQHFNEMYGNISEQLKVKREKGIWLYMGGVGMGGMASLLSLWLLLALLSDIISDTYDPRQLEDEVRGLATNQQFKSRITLLLPEDNRDTSPEEWKLHVTKTMPEQYTHVCFKAVATRGDQKVHLWGRRYKWAGYIKSFQRIFFPAFANATWRALCHMHNNDLPSPVPVVYQRLRVGPFKAGAIILMESMGEVRSVNKFICSDFCLLSTDAQNELLKSVGQLIHALHNMGIYGIKPRYLHGQNFSDRQKPTRIYLFDLDKVLLWKNCPSWLARLLKWKDKRRLVRKLDTHLKESQIQILTNTMDHPSPTSPGQ